MMSTDTPKDVAEHRIVRTGRVHITSPDGLHYTTAVRLPDGNDLTFPVTEVAWRSEAGQPTTAYLKCYLASIDLLTDAEMEIHTLAMLRLERDVQRLLSFIATMPASEDRDTLLSEIGSRAYLWPTNEYVTQAQQRALLAEFEAVHTAETETE